MVDVPAALAKMTETALAVSDLDSPKDWGAAVAALYYIDRTQAGGFYARQASEALDSVIQGIETCTGVPVKHAREYFCYLVCRYGKMATEASTPSKLKLIHAAFFSEFKEEFAYDANVAMFRDLVEKLDYNEALFLAGLWELHYGEHPIRDRCLVRGPHHDDYQCASDDCFGVGWNSTTSEGATATRCVDDDCLSVGWKTKGALGTWVGTCNDEDCLLNGWTVKKGSRAFVVTSECRHRSKSDEIRRCQSQSPVT